MVDLEALEKDIKSGNIKNCYIMCGTDENLIKESVQNLINKVIDKDFLELNLTRFDGNKVEFDEVMNACETLPFMSDKKVVIVFRAIFLADKEDRENKNKFEAFNKYVQNLPPHCILLMYYIMQDDREKPGNNLKKLEKKCTLVKVDKLKGERLYKKVGSIFEAKGKNIDKALLKFFCDNIENNMDIIKNEIDKLVSYVEDKPIVKQDIMDLLPQMNNDDIFDLVDFISQKKPEKALNILNELIFKGESITSILFMVVRQFKLLYKIKGGMSQGKDKDTIARELKLHPYVCEKLMTQSKKFSVKQVKACLELCMNTEKSLKTSQLDKKTEMEMLLINTVRA